MLYSFAIAQKTKIDKIWIICLHKDITIKNLDPVDSLFLNDKCIIPSLYDSLSVNYWTFFQSHALFAWSAKEKLGRFRSQKSYHDFCQLLASSLSSITAKHLQ